MSPKKIFGIVAVVASVIVLGSLLVTFYATPPTMPKIRVINASLSQFYLNNNTLYYNLALNLALQNPSRTKQIDYKHIEVTARYLDERFPLETLISKPFKQGTRDTDVLQPHFQGQQTVKFSEKDLSRFESETVGGAYTFDVAVVLQIKRIADKPHAMCMLKVPMSLNSTSGGGSFHVTACSVQKD